MNAIEIKNLEKGYGDFRLGPFSLSLPSGAIMGLVGENGAGKSTTIKLMLGMIKRNGGEITLLGRDDRDNLKLAKEDIGVVLDEVGISGCLTPLSLGKILRNSYRNWDDDAYMGYLRRFSLPEKKKFKDFSKGMKMKLGLAVALSHGAKLLILDEATSGLDPVVRDEILDLFMEFTRDEGNSILVSSHIVSDLEKICDYIAFLHRGKLMLCEEKDVLRESYRAVHVSAEQLREIAPEAIVGKKENPYGVEAIVKREAIPESVAASPVDIEPLFIFLTKEARA